MLFHQLGCESGCKFYFMSISLSYFLDTRRVRKDGTYPIYLRISCRGKKELYKIGESLKDDFEDFTRGSTKKGAQRIKAFIVPLYEKAKEITSTMSVFNKRNFELKFYSEETEPKLEKTVEEMFRKIIRNMFNEDRIGSRDAYKTTLNSILNFHNSKSKLYFEDITKVWLINYEKWLISKGRSISTVGIYCRTLRAAYNNAIHERWVDRSLYPFGRRDFKIPATKNVKKALNIHQIRLIRNYTPQDKNEAFARDMFIFSYFCNGINIKDVCRLTYGNLGRDIITFYRSKTSNSSKVLEPIKIALLPEVREIIYKWGNKPCDKKGPQQPLFPFFNGEETAIQVRDKTKRVLKRINKYMKVISENLDLGVENIATYHSRHSYASISKNAGISVQNISESLGHSSLAVTKSYLASLDDEIIHKNAQILL